jgi:hypothetical protein
MAVAVSGAYLAPFDRCAQRATKPCGPDASVAGVKSAEARLSPVTVTTKPDLAGEITV